MKHVFVSYSRNNLDAVTRLVEDLKKAGVETWHDQALTGGQKWWDCILDQIRSCDIFIFALSRESWESEACRSELGYVSQLGKPILPVLLTNDIPLSHLPPPLNAYQATDYRQGDKDAAIALARAIYMSPPAPPLPDPLPVAPDVPKSYLSDLRERIESHEPMTLKGQVALHFELEEEAHKGRSTGEVRELLLKMKERDDLLARVSAKIDETLEEIDERAAAPPAKKPEPAPAARRDTQPVKTDDAPRPPDAGPKLCPRCRTQAPSNARFCGSCGLSLGEAGGSNLPARVVGPPPAVNPQPPPAQEDRSKVRHYMCAPSNTQRLISDVKGWLDSQGFDSQQMNTETDGLLLQIKKRGGWRDYVGMATSLNIVFEQSGDTLTVEIGAGKWIDKAAVGTVSLFVLWPLAVTAGFGAWEQAKMPERIFDFIGARLLSK